MRKSSTYRFGFKHFLFGWFAAAVAFGLPVVAVAASATWNGGTGTQPWTTGSNWSTSTVPGSGDTATFNNATHGASQTLSVTSGTINTILFDTASAAAYTIGASASSGTITLNDAGAVTINSPVVNNETINSVLLLGTSATAASYTFTNNSTSTLMFAGKIQPGAGGTGGVKTLNIAGSGNTTISGNVSGGSISVNDTSGGTLGLLGAANTVYALNVNGGAASVVNLTGGSLTFGAAAGGATIQSTSGGGTITGGTINLTGGAAGNYADIGAQTGTLTINSIITGNGIDFHNTTSPGTTVLTALNTYTGVTDIQNQIVSVTTIGNSGAAGNLGTNATINLGTTTNNATLKYTGPGETTNRVINLNSTTGPATIDASGSGLLKFASNLTATGSGSKTLTLQGSGSGQIAGVIVNFNSTNITSVTKAGSGVWTLSNLSATAANNYTGTTTIDQGTLVINNISPSLTGGLTFGAAARNTNAGNLDLSAASATFAGAGLVQTNTATNTITIGNGKTLTLGGGLTMGTDNPTQATTSNLTISGSGTLAITGGNVQLGVSQGTINAANNDKVVLDLTGLGGFSASVTNFNIGQGNTSAGTLSLSNVNNSITATTVDIGDSGANNGVSNSMLILGTGTNGIFADTINVGRGKGSDPGYLQFASQAAGSAGTITIANKLNNGPANIDIANINGAGTAGGAIGALDLRGHMANVSAGTITIGNNNGTSTGSTSGTLSFDTGTFTVNTLNVAPKSAAGVTTANGLINVGGGVFTVNSGFTLGSEVTAGTSAATLNLTGGSFSSNVDILKGAGTVVATITINGGTLNMNGHNLGGAIAINTISFQTGAIANLGEINNGVSGLVKSTTGTLALISSNNYTAGTTLSNGLLSIQASNALGPGNDPLTINGGTMDISGNFSESVGNLTGFGGTVINSNPGTTATLVIGSGNATGGNYFGTLTNGAGTLALSKVGSGTILLSSPNTYTGNTTVNAGVLALGAGASLSNGSNLVVNGGTASSIFQLSGGTLNGPQISMNAGSVIGGTFLVKGSTTIGASGSPTLTVSGGSTSAQAATLSLVDGTFNTLTLNTATSASPVLVLGSSAGSPANLSFEIGMGSAGDQIAFAGGAQATVNAGGSLVTVTAPTGYDGSPHVLISSPTTDLTATSAGTAAFVLNAAAGNWSGYNLALATTPSAITVSGTANASQPTLYFKGGLDGNWNTFAGGAANNSNWTTDAAGTTDGHVGPGATTDVHFYATSATTANLGTTLNQSYTINSLTLDGGTNSAAVSIAPGGGTLTINAASGTGITVNAGAGALTVSAPIALGGSQSWTNNSSSAMTVSGNVSGSSNLVLSTASSMVVSGANSAYSGTTTLNAGRLIAQNPAATNVLQALGTGNVVLNGGTLQAQADGTGSFQTIVASNNTVVAGGGTTTIDVERQSSSTFDAIQFSNLTINGGTASQLATTGGNGYVLNFAGTTSINGPANLSPGSSPLNLLGPVIDNGNGAAIAGTGVARLFNTSATTANSVTGTLVLNGGTLEGFAPAAAAAVAGSNSLGTATIALQGSNPLLLLAPNLAGGLTVATTQGLAAKGYQSGTTLSALAATNFLGPNQAVTNATDTALNIPLTGGTIGALNISSTTGFPTTTSYQFTGLLNINTAGVYSFSSSSDDNGNLFIDGNSPIATTTNTVTNSYYLTAGLHTFGMRVNNNGGPGSILIQYQGQDQAALAPIPASAYSMVAPSALATNFGNNLSLAASTNAAIQVASNTTLGGLTMIGSNSAGNTLTVNGAGDINTLTFSGSSLLTSGLTINDPTANVAFTGLSTSDSTVTLTKTGFGTLTLAGSSSLGASTLVLNGGIVDLGGSNRNMGSISLISGTVQNGTLITPSSTFVKQGNGAVTFATVNNPGAYAINQGTASIASNPAAYAPVTLDFSNATAPASNILASSATLTLGGPVAQLYGGGALALVGSAGASNSQTLATTLVDGGASNLSLTAGTAGSLALGLGTLSRNPGGTVDVTLSSGGAPLAVTVANPGMAGTIVTSASGTAFATVAGTDWAAYSSVSPGNLVPASIAGATGGSIYTSASDAASFSGDADVISSLVANAGTTVNSIRFNTGALTLTNSGTTTVATGGVLVGSGVTGAATITGGTLVPGAGQEMVFITGKPITNPSLSISSVIADGLSGPTAVTFRGSPNGGTLGGQFEVRANNTYTGPTYITQGRVTLSASGVTTPLGTGPNAIIYVDGNADGQFAIDGNGSGDTVSNPFVIIGTGFNETGSRRGVLRLDSSTTSSSTLTGPITLLGDSSIGNNSAGTAGVSVISGNIGTSNVLGSTSFAVNKVMTGNIELTGSNSQTATNINAGVLSINADAALGTSAAPLTFTGASTLQFSNSGISLNASRNIVLNAAASFDTGTLTTSQPTFINGTISGAGTFTKSYTPGGQQTATAPLYLTGSNSFTGNVTINYGLLAITNSLGLGTGTKTITINLGTNGQPGLVLDPAQGLTPSTPIVLPSTTTFVTSSATGQGAIINSSGNNIINGNVTMTSGGGATLLTSNAGSITFNGNVSPNQPSRTLNFAGNGLGIINGAIANGSTTQMPVIQQSGTGTWTLNGTNTYTGNTQIQAGTLQIGNSSALGLGFTNPITTASTTKTNQVSSGATIDLNGINVGNQQIQIAGTGNGGAGALINSNTAATAVIGSGLASASIISNSGASSATVTVSGGGSGATVTANLGVTASSFTISSGSDVYSGAPTVTISGGGGSGATATAILTGGSVTGITITSAGTGYTSTPTVAFSGGTVTSGSVAPSGTGNSTNFVVNSISITNVGSGYSVPTFTDGTAAFAPAGGGVVLTDNASVGGPGNIRVDGGVSGTGQLTKVGAGTLLLSNSNAYTGGTVVGGGVLQLGNAAALAGGALAANGGTLDLNGFGTTVSSFSGASGTVLNSSTNSVTLIVNQAVTTTFSGLVTNGSGTTALAKRGTGTLVLTGSNSYSGGTTIGLNNNTGNVGGTVLITNGAALGTGNVSVIAGDPPSTSLGAQLELAGNITVNNPTILTSGYGYLAANGVIRNLSGNNTINSAIGLTGGAGSSAVGSDAGTLTLAGSISATSATRALFFVGAGNINVSGAISDGATTGMPITLNGSGQVTLSNSNSYTGGTTVNSGTLLIANSAGSATGPGSVTLNGGVLASTAGTIGGSLVAGGGSHTIAPGGIGAIGTLAVGGSASFNANSTLDFDVSGSSTDLLSIAGSLSGSGIVAVDITNLGSLGSLANSYTLATYAGLSGLTFSPSLSGLPLAYQLHALNNDLVLSVPTGTPIWQIAGSGSWTNQSNWSTFSVPNAVGATAIVGTATNSTWSITLDSPQTVGTLIFANSGGNTAAGYSLDAGTAGSLTLDNSGAAAQIVVTNGTHAITAPVYLVGGDLSVSASSNGVLTISGSISQDTSRNLTLGGDGSGELILSGTNNLGGSGALATVTAGTLQLNNIEALAEGTSLTVGDASFFGGIQPAGGAASAASGGTVISIAPVPEPGTLAILSAVVGAAAIYRRARRRQARR